MAPRLGCLAAIVVCALLAAALCLLSYARHPTGEAPQTAGENAGDAGGAGEPVGVPAGDAGGGADVSDGADGATASRGDQEGLVVTVERGEAEQVATRLLSSYRDAGDCALASSGYLDLFGSVWGCVVQGDGWVDVCIVSEEGSGSRVAVLRLEGAAVARQLLGDDGEE